MEDTDPIDDRQGAKAGSEDDPPSSDDDVRLIGRGGALMFAGMAAHRALAYGTAMLIGRGLGAAVFGDYGLVMGLERFTRAFADGGLRQANLKFISASLAVNDRGGARSVAWVTSSISLLLSGLLFVALWFLAPVLAADVYGRPELADAFRIAAGAIPLASVMVTLLSVVQASKNITPLVAIERVGVPLLFLSGAALVVLRDGELTGLIWAYFGATATGVAAAAVVVLLWLRRHRGPSSGVSLRELVGYAAVICVATGANMVLSAADVLILGRYVSAEQLGIYVAASRTARFVVLPLNATNPLLTPVASDLWERREIEALRHAYRTASRWAMGGAFAIVGPMMIVPAVLMGLFGSQFTGGALVLMVVAAGELVNVTTGGVGMMLYMTGGQRIVAITNVAAAIVVSGALFLVCPVYGVIGAAVCMGAGRGGVNLVRLWWLWRRRDIHPYNARFGICTAVTVVLIVIAMLVGNAGGLQALGAVIGFYVCFGIVVWYGWLGAEGFALRNLRPADSDGSVEEDR